MKKNIDNLSFNQIKNEMDFIINFHSILLKTVTDKDYTVYNKFDVKIYLESAIKVINDGKLAN